VSGGSAASLPASVEELRALVVELLAANAGLREVIAAKDHQIASLERRIVEWRASHIPDSGSYKVRSGMEDATC
jgi:hypothetical protein